MTFYCRYTKAATNILRKDKTIQNPDRFHESKLHDHGHKNIHLHADKCPYTSLFMSTGTHCFAVLDLTQHPQTPLIIAAPVQMEPAWEEMKSHSSSLEIQAAGQIVKDVR